MSDLTRSLERWIESRGVDVAASQSPQLAAFEAAVDRLRAGLQSLVPADGLDVLLVSHRQEYFDVPDVERSTGGGIRSVRFCGTDDELLALGQSFHVALICTHATGDHLPQLAVRARALAPLVVVWTWDNHHMRFENLCSTALADLVLPAHAFCGSDLKSPHAVVGRSFPLCSAQWSRELAAAVVAGEPGRARSDSLHGGYIMWPASERNPLLRALRDELPDAHLSLIEADDRGAYFSLGPDARLQDWASHKVSIQLPYANDLSLRVFDALIAGQIPIVPASCYDLDAVVPPALQESLPIVRIDDVSTASIAAAWHSALSRFDAMGEVGVLSRHSYAMTHHHIAVRLAQIIDYVAGLRAGFDVALRVDGTSVGLVLAD
jgi:hypothetical protein